MNKKELITAIAEKSHLTFKVRAERKEGNPKTGEDIVVPQPIVPVFKTHTSSKVALKTTYAKEDI